MKRSIVFLFFITFVLGVYGQYNGITPDYKKPIGERLGKAIDITTKDYSYAFSIGPTVGVGIPYMIPTYDQKGHGYIDWEGTFCWKAGAALNVRFGNKDKRDNPLYGQGLLGAGLELCYITRSAKAAVYWRDYYVNSGQDGGTLRLNSLEIPLLLQIYPAYKNMYFRNLYIELGPSFSMVVNSYGVVSNWESWDETFVRGTMGRIRSEDVNLAVGVGWRVNKNLANAGFYFNLRYTLATQSLATNFPLKINTAELNVGYLFNCIFVV